MRPDHWERKAEEIDFYDLKGLAENLLAGLSIARPGASPASSSLFHPGRQLALTADNQVVATLGEIHPTTLRHLKIDHRVYFAEFNLHALFKAKKSDIQMRDLPLYPASQRDWTLTLKEETPAEEIVAAIQSVRSYLLEKLTLADLWRGERLGAGRKNLTFNFLYRDPNRTLSVEEIENEHARITQGVLEKLTRDGKTILPSQ
jgi:phenylalanyl-tRNA synthetase beta chain